MSKSKRTVQAHLDRNGIVIFQLQQGIKKLRTMHTFGYGTYHKVWMKVDGMGTERTVMFAESASFVKEQIAQWTK